jgi:hypothetical protein
MRGNFRRIILANRNSIPSVVLSVGRRPGKGQFARPFRHQAVLQLVSRLGYTQSACAFCW